MSTLNLDPQQMEAVEHTDSDILVSASAGAGKTKVLVERLIKRCCIDRIPLDRILAVTFTQAAAGEMKNRVNARLQEELQNAVSEHHSDLQEWIESQMILIDSADITTIDSFCLTIIEKYCTVISLNPASSQHVLDDGEHDALLKDSFQIVLNDYELSHHKELLEVLNRFCQRSEDYDTLLEILIKISDHADASASPHEWFEKARSHAEMIQRLDQMPEDVLNSYDQSLHLILYSMRQDLKTMAVHSSDTDKLNKANAADSTASLCNALENLNALLEHRSYDLFTSCFYSMGELKSASDGKAEEYTAARKSFYANADALAKILYDSSIQISDHNDNVPLIHTLIDLAERTEAEFQHQKQINACMDFTDMERYALEILTANDNAVSLLYKKHFDEVMVDEFQDTSILQNRIIEMLAKPNTIFRVGDVKQSIYRFRQARPELMRSMLKDPKIYRITLKHNYRSRSNIVDFCNLLFARLMNAEGCQDHYDQEDTVSIGTDRQKLSKPCPIRFFNVDVHLNDETDIPEDSEDHSAETDRADEPPAAKTAKADCIAREILRLVREEGSSFSDMAVLLRSHNDKPILRQVFEHYHIPYDIDAREGFYHSDLCMTIRAVLTCMLNPADPVALLTAATSPLGGLSDQILAELKIRHGSVYQGIQKEHPELLDLLSQFREIARRDGLCALLNAIAASDCFYESLDSSQKSNFDFLFEKTVKLEQTRRSVYDLMDMMNASDNEKSSEAMSRSRDDQAVTVTTIHQSKGLQYKNVFLFSSSKSLNQEKSSDVMVDDSLCIGIRHMDMPYRTMRPTIDRLAIEYKDNLEDLEEYTRLLYVALTRAEERLYIVDTAAKKETVPGDRITLATLAERKGMSGLLRQTLQPIAGLYEVCTVGLEEAEPEAPLPEKYAAELPHYQGNVQTLSVSSTPSSAELTFLPDLDPDTHENGTRYGTLMHETLAELPNRLWTAEDLKDTDISDQDKQRILMFGSSDLYRKALTMEIHHEYPFYLERDGFRMHGVMDFAAIGEKEILLIDYKTDSAKPEEILNRYKDQLNAYRKALYIIYPGRSVSVYAWSLHHSKAILIPEEGEHCNEQ